jgi:hypothetical protein
LILIHGQIRGAAQQRGHPAGVGEGEGSIRPGPLAAAGYRRGLGEPDGKEGVLIAGAPAKERQPAARFGYLDPGQVRAQSVPAAGGVCREDGRITAAAPDVENVLPVLDLRAGQQPRRQPAPHPLPPLTLLDKVPPAGSVPVLGLLRIHRHEGNATSPRPAWTGPRTLAARLLTEARVSRFQVFQPVPTTVSSSQAGGSVD